MTTFKSIAVLDTETTSLPQNDHRTTKITELAILACEIDHLRDSQELPRVLHKFVLLFNPERFIHPQATSVTGLYNELLMNIKPFTEEDAVALEHFLSRLPSPVCIVAHNGNIFDFPILRKTLQKAKKDLPNDIYCADTLIAFKKLLPAAENTFQAKRVQKQAKNETTPKRKRTQPVNALQYKSVARELFPDDEKPLFNDSEFSESPSSQDDKVNIVTGTSPPKSCESDNEKHFPNNREFSKWASSQEDKVSTVAGTSRPESCKSHVQKQLFNDSEFSESPSSQDDKVSTIAGTSCPKSCKSDNEKHFPSNREFSKWASSQEDKVSTVAGTSRPKSYKLRDIYYFYFKDYFTDSHRAEEDAKALLKCIVQCQGFLEWMSQNAVFFNSIEPL